MFSLQGRSVAARICELRKPRETRAVSGNSFKTTVRSYPGIKGLGLQLTDKLINRSKIIQKTSCKGIRNFVFLKTSRPARVLVLTQTPTAVHTNLIQTTIVSFESP